MIRVLVTDDSPTARELLVAILTSDPEIVVVGQARHGLEAVELTKKLKPDLVTMDIRMPRMDGFEATKEIMINAPTPILIVTSSMVAHDLEASMHALRAGALAILAKPQGPQSPTFEVDCQQLLMNVKALSQVKVVRHWRHPAPDKKAACAVSSGTVQVVAIVTSTGGPAALHRIFSDLPGNFPVPILVVQHITRGFGTGLADWLNKETDLHVKLAQHGEAMAAHTVYLAPDDYHLGLADRQHVQLDRSLPIEGFKPSGTFLFQAVARVFGNASLAVILTGMGSDGVEGLRAVRAAGGRILAQDEKSSIIFGMPGSAIEAGLADQVLPLDKIANRLVELVLAR